MCLGSYYSLLGSGGEPASAASVRGRPRRSLCWFFKIVRGPDTRLQDLIAALGLLRRLAKGESHLQCGMPSLWYIKHKVCRDRSGCECTLEYCILQGTGAMVASLTDIYRRLLESLCVKLVSSCVLTSSREWHRGLGLMLACYVTICGILLQVVCCWANPGSIWCQAYTRYILKNRW